MAIAFSPIGYVSVSLSHPNVPPDLFVYGLYIGLRLL